MKIFFIFFVILLQSNISLQANSCTSAGNGNWDNAGTWVCGRMPLCGDSITILAGHTVTIRTQQDYFSSCSTSMYINVYGKLIIRSGFKLALPVGAVVEIEPGATLEPSIGGGSSNLLDIGGANVWTAEDGIVPGYRIFRISGLPITLVKFEAMNTGNTIDITWVTASETNNDFFTIEKSKDAVHFETVSSLDGAGNSSSVLNYYLKDYQPFDGLSYYRLSQTDLDGTTTHSHLIEATFNRKADFSFKIYPNPNDGVCINLDMIASKGEVTKLMMTDFNGKEIYSKEISISSAEENVYTFCSEERLLPGIYFVKVIASQKEYTKKVVVE